MKSKRPVEVVIAEVLTERVADGSTVFFVIEINNEVAKRCNYEPTALHVTQTIERLYDAHKVRWEYSDVLVWDFPHKTPAGVPVRAGRNALINVEELAALPPHLQEIVAAPMSPASVAWCDAEAARLRAEGQIVLGWPMPDESGRDAT